MPTKIQIVSGDITQQEVGAIVNAANNSLLGGGGVDGAIHRAGGSQILEECRAIRARQGGCKTGEAVITTAGKLPARYVIHTVGPVWNGGDKGENELLASAYRQSLLLAKGNGIKTIAFPNISTGIYRFPKALAAEIVVETVKQLVAANPDDFQQIAFVCFDAENYGLYKKQLG